MPPLQYRLLHWNAILSATDLQALATLNTSAPAEASLTGAGDPIHGKLIFEKRCTGCHAIDADHEGPRLRRVFNRKAATVPTFNYSTALTHSNITWNDTTLDHWLTDTDAMVPNSDMSFRVLKATERLDLIAFLKQQN